MTTMDGTETARKVARIGRDEAETIEILGIHLDWKVREADTDGQYCVLEMHVPPHAGVPLHQHVSPETFFISEGAAEFGCMGPDGTEWFTVGLGDTVHVPSWAWHGFRNTSAAPARIVLTCAHGIEPFFGEAGIPVAPGTPLPSDPPAQSAIERVITLAIKDGQRFAPMP